MRHETIMQIVTGVLSILFLILIWKEVRKLNPLVTALTGAVNDNTVAVNAAVAALKVSGGLSAADQAALTAATTQVVANTAALVNATPAAAAPNPPGV